MKILIALGGNALLERGQPLEADIQKKNVEIAAKQIAKIVKGNEVIIAHGNGPQVGLLALQNENYKSVHPYPFDILVAQTEGMIGYLLQQKLMNEIDSSRSVVSVVTQVEVDPNDPGFKNPSKPIGQIYDKETADRLAKERNWTMMEDGKNYRRCIASPKPKKIIELNTIQSLIDRNVVTICSGGGGIPVMFDRDGKLQGVEAVIDKDSCSSLLARQLNFDLFVIATDVKGVFMNWGTSDQKMLREVKASELLHESFAKGSMGPKVMAVAEFTNHTKNRAVIGSLSDIEHLISGTEGTQVVY